MPKLVVYNSMSLDGYFTDANGDMDWAHKQDPEWQAFLGKATPLLVEMRSVALVPAPSSPMK